MVLDRERFLFLAAVLGGCHEPPPKVTGSVTLTPVASSTEAPPPPDFCKTVIAQNDALLAKPGGSCDEYAAQEKDVRAKIPEDTKGGFFHTCHVGKGTWAVRVTTVALGAPAGEAGGCGWSAKYEWIFQPTGGPAVARSGEGEWMHFPDTQTTSESSTFFDYNGDGTDEAIVSEATWGNGGGGDETWQVMRADGPVIARFNPGFAFDGVVDADGDGRPDLLEGAYFHVMCDQGLAPQMTKGVAVLHHSLANGTFSMTDDVARRWSVTSCPSAMPSHTEEGECALHASCQRVWGRSPDEIKKWAVSQPACNVFCMDPSMTRELVNQPLPFKGLNVDTPAPFPPKKRGP
jgi:hypothetical protein